MRCDQIGGVVRGEEKQRDDKEGDSVKGCFLREGVVEIWCAKWSLSEDVGAQEH